MWLLSIALFSAADEGRFVSSQAYFHHMVATYAGENARWREARRNAELGLVYDDASPALRRTRARATWRQGQRPEREPDPWVQAYGAAARDAWPAVRRFLASERPHDGAIDRAWLELSVQMYAAGYRKDAWRLWRGILPGTPALRSRLGPRLLEDWADITRDPELARMDVELKARRGNWASAAAAAEAGRRLHPGALDAALAWARWGDPEADLLEELLRVVPGARPDLIRALADGGRPELALALAQSRTERGIALERLGRWVELRRLQPTSSAPLLMMIGAGRAASARRGARVLSAPERARVEATAAWSQGRLDEARTIIESEEVPVTHWGLWWTVTGTLPPNARERAEEVWRAWSQRPLEERLLGPPSPWAEAWATIALAEEDEAALCRARWLDPMHPRVLQAELTSGPAPALRHAQAVAKAASDPLLAAALGGVR